jgi:maltoporin
MRLKHTLLAAAALSVLSTAASAVEWGGYTRVGPGQKQNSGDSKRCFNGGAPVGKGGIGRLGNECETYGEFALSETAEVGGVKYKALLMTNFFNGGSEPGGDTLGVQQIYVEGKGYNVMPNQTFWIGRRFYRRTDVHMDDAFFTNLTGTGAGVDGFNLGIGTLGVAVFRTKDDPTTGPNAVTNPGTRVNVDLGNIAVNPGGQLTFTTAFTDYSGTGGKNGTGLSLMHVQSGLPTGATNTLWAQWAQGSAGLDMGFGAATDSSSAKRWRIADSLAWLKGPLTGQTLFQIGRDKRAGAEDKYYSVGGRAAYAFTTNFKLQAELGFASKDPQGPSKKQNVNKFTIAPTLTVGQDYYSRPELRFYVSRFSFNDAYRTAEGQSKKSKTAAGFQAEIWF